MQDLKVALIQTEQVWENKEANYKHLEENHFTKLKPGDCDLVILPEMFNTGFSMKTKELAETMNGKSIVWLKKWAKHLDCQIAASLIIVDQEKFYNRFVVVSANEIICFYDKRHLFRMANENTFFEPGQKKVILLQVCYDLRFPVFSRNKFVNKSKEYEAVIYIANWPEKRSFVWDVLLQARAAENQAYCIGVNRVGLDGNNYSYSGDSACIDPWGSTVYRATKSTEEVKILTLSSAVLREAERSFPVYLDAD